eukprot:1307438-Amorphochlora_amoeboformis.AAC.1
MCIFHGIAAVAHQSKIAVPGESPVTNYRDSPFRPALPPKRHSLPLSVHVSPYSPYSPPGTPDALLARKFTAVSGKGIITGSYNMLATACVVVLSDIFWNGKTNHLLEESLLKLGE